MMNLPKEIKKYIKEYIPKDKLMRSPTDECIRPYITLYNIYEFFPLPFYIFAFKWRPRF